MATMQRYITARTAKRCDDYPRCDRGIKPGERYLRAVATPWDSEVNQSPHWWTLNICCVHMYPEGPCGLGNSAPIDESRSREPAPAVDSHESFGVGL